MKARHEFRYEKDYYDYLHNIYMMNAMKAIITQNLMYAETDEVEEKNRPEVVYNKAKSLADYFVDKLKQK